MKLPPKCAAAVSTEQYLNRLNKTVEQLPRDREAVAPPRFLRTASLTNKLFKVHSLPSQITSVKQTGVSLEHEISVSEVDGMCARKP